MRGDRMNGSIDMNAFFVFGVFVLVIWIAVKIIPLRSQDL